jgi:hypothetical protein
MSESIWTTVEVLLESSRRDAVTQRLRLTRRRLPGPMHARLGEIHFLLFVFTRRYILSLQNMRASSKFKVQTRTGESTTGGGVRKCPWLRPEEPEKVEKETSASIV